MTAMKKKIHFAHKIVKPVDKPEEQLLEFPLSISDNDGNLLKGQKSYFTKALQARYKESSPPIITLTCQQIGHHSAPYWKVCS